MVMKSEYLTWCRYLFEIEVNLGWLLVWSRPKCRAIIVKQPHYLLTLTSLSTSRHKSLSLDNNGTLPNICLLYDYSLKEIQRNTCRSNFIHCKMWVTLRQETVVLTELSWKSWLKCQRNVTAFEKQTKKTTI